MLNHVAAASGISVGAQVVVSAEHRQLRVRVVGIVEEVGAAGVVYLNRAEFARAFGPPRLARATTLAVSAAERTQTIRALEGSLLRVHAPVEAVIPFAELRTAVGDHVLILVRSLMALAATLSVVGLLGLASAVGTSVLERTREIGVMKAVGASRRDILKLFLAEGALTALLSWALAIVLALPLSALVESMIGRLGFLAPLPFVISVGAAAGWLALVGPFSLLSTWVPARRAARISVKEAIAAG